MYRMVPTDGRQHTPLQELDGTYTGESVGPLGRRHARRRFVGLQRNTWFDQIGGYMHGENMHVVERFTRNGNTLTWTATIEDPDYLLEPWTTTPRVRAAAAQRDAAGIAAVQRTRPRAHRHEGTSLVHERQNCRGSDSRLRLCADDAIRARAGRPERAKVLRAAADALGMVRWSDIGGANTRLPGIDIVNTMEFQGSGTSELGGRAVKTDYHVALGYNPAAMRVEITRTPDGGAAQRSIQTVRETWAWDESQIGAGLVPERARRRR